MHFPDLPVINRGFGGSQISQVNHYLQETTLKYAPATIVFYGGDNDINAGKTAERVLADYTTFVTRVHAARPSTRIVFLAIKPSLARWTIWPEMQRANALIKTFSERGRNLQYLDLAPEMIGADGRPRRSLFVDDGLHLSAEGYALWSAALRKVLR